ncbi:uncharacterized protein METZ01_LOCUS302090 [marine metagenome]|uniref:site-specific DNA-methyltransferase (adenine-specific) n=1 Tax=marine metagenome TaxID=408172 RepID=A0A382MKG7_9ZZZZ
MKNQVIKPLFMWAGGKTKMMKHYNQLLPNDVKTYTEAFLGGGAMFLNVVDKFNIKKAYLNDVNSDLIEIYKSIKNDVDLFCTYMDDLQKKYMSVSYVNGDKTERKKFYLDKREEYIKMYDTWPKEDNGIERSAVLYFLMKTGFNGIWQSSIKANGKFYTPAGLLNHKEGSTVYDISNVMMWSKLLNDTDVELTSKDWSQVTMGDFTFYDPPYRDSFTSYNTEFGDEEHKKLIKRVEECEDGKTVWLCNRDAHDGFFKSTKATIETFPITYTAGRRKQNDDGSHEAKQATEILMYNHTPEKKQEIADLRRFMLMCY